MGDKTGINCQDVKGIFTIQFAGYKIDTFLVATK